MTVKENIENRIAKLKEDKDRADLFVVKTNNTLIEIPNNATNGDVIKALFPKADIDGRHKEVYVVIDDEVLDFSENWWNAPYKKGGE